MLSISELADVVAACCASGAVASRDQVALAKSRTAFLTITNIVPLRTGNPGCRRHRRYDENACYLIALFAFLIAAGIRTERFNAIADLLTCHPLWPVAKAGQSVWICLDLDPVSQAADLAITPDLQPGQLTLLLETSQLFGTVKRAIAEVEAQRARRRK